MCVSGRPCPPKSLRNEKAWQVTYHTAVHLRGGRQVEGRDDPDESLAVLCSSVRDGDGVFRVRPIGDEGAVEERYCRELVVRV